MEHTNEFLARVYGAYMGSNVAQFINDKEGVFGKLVAIEQDRCYAQMDAKTQSFAFYSDCRLLLRPLSAISDEDAVEVAKIMTQATACDWSGCEKKYTQNFINLLVLGKDNSFEDSECDDVFKSGVGVQIIDYLRSKSYDCGYMHLPSLIEAGIASQIETP